MCGWYLNRGIHAIENRSVWYRIHNGQKDPIYSLCIQRRRKKKCLALGKITSTPEMQWRLLHDSACFKCKTSHSEFRTLLTMNAFLFVLFTAALFLAAGAPWTRILKFFFGCRIKPLLHAYLELFQTKLIQTWLGCTSFWYFSEENFLCFAERVRVRFGDLAYVLAVTATHAANDRYIKLFDDFKHNFITPFYTWSCECKFPQSIR